MLAISVPGLSLRHTFRSCQSLMWDMRFACDGAPYWTVTSGPHCCKVSQVKDRLLVSGSEEEFFGVWFEYFDLAEDYVELDLQCAKMCYAVAKAARRAHGVRMLRVDPLESMLTQTLWWRCDSSEARRRLKAVCGAVGERKKKSFNGTGPVEFRMVPDYDSIMRGQKALKAVLSPENLFKVLSLYDWFESHRSFLMTSEGHSPSPDDIERLLLESNLLRPRQIARVMRDAYGVRGRACLPERFWSQVSKASGCERREAFDAVADEALGGNASYVSVLMQAAYGV